MAKDNKDSLSDTKVLVETFTNNVQPKYLERKSNLKKDFPSAYAFLENIENKTNDGFHVGTVKHLHLYYQDWLLFYFEFLSNTSIRIGTRHGEIKNHTTPKFDDFFEVLRRNFAESELKDYESFEFNKTKNKYSLTINNSENCDLIFDLIYKTLDEIKNKNYQCSINYSDIQQDFEEKIRKAQKLSDKQLEAKLNKTQTNSQPTKIITQRPVYRRNEYVTESVLRRANGICEKCGRPAPFLRDKDNTPFLEVHHKIPLSEEGYDTMENAIALCPNCHRHAHSGKSTY
jgi:hypothetical protein